MMSFPLMVRAIRLALEGVDVKLEQAARTLGARPLAGIFDHYACRLTLPGIIVGTVLAFARSLGRVWRDHHVCLEHSRRNAHHPFGDVHPDSNPGRGRRGGAPVHHLNRVWRWFRCWCLNGWRALSRERMGR